jgi:2-dehydropantoate 2-reductase
MSKAEKENGLKIAVIGAGAIGGLVAGYLKFRQANVSLVGRHSTVTAIQLNGLSISGTRGNIKVNIDITESLSATPDMAIFTVKTQDCERAIKDNLKFLKETTLITTQNGIQADTIVARYIPAENIISSIIMFGATFLEPGKIVHNFEGPWVIGRLSGPVDAKLNTARSILKECFPMVVSDDIKGMKYLKIFLNANNCIPAILGSSMQEAFSDVEVSRIGIAIWKEGLEVIAKAGIKLCALPDVPVERVTNLTSMAPAQSSRILSEIMVNLSRVPLYGSILQSIKRERPSEIDYINGEFVHLAKLHKIKAPLNERLVEMVHMVERTRKFFSKHHLLSEVQGLL